MSLPWVKWGQYFLFNFLGGKWEAEKIDDPSLFSLQMGLRRLGQSSVQFLLGPLTGKHLFVSTMVFYDSQSKLNIEGPHPFWAFRYKILAKIESLWKRRDYISKHLFFVCFVLFSFSSISWNESCAGHIGTLFSWHGHTQVMVLWLRKIVVMVESWYSRGWERKLLHNAQCKHI